jgi:glycosyltransferase involved in cell wall biosynthesis
VKHLLLYSDMAAIYGAEQVTHALALGFARAGWRVTVAQPYAAHHLAAEQHAAGIAHRWLEPDLLWDSSRPARMLTDHGEPERVLDEVRPDLVLFSDGAPMSLLTAKEVAARLRVPYIVLCHCASGVWARPFADAVARLPGVYAQAREIVAVSHENRDVLRRHFGLPPEAGIVIQNGRPDAFFAPRSAATRQRVREALGIPADAVVSMTVGRMDLVKGYQYQIAAMKPLRASPAWPSLHFVWVGDGGLAEQLRGLAARLRIDDKVHLLARRNDVPDLLDAADLFVLPSLFEGMPLAVIEAMAKGLPVVASAVSGTPEALGDAGRVLATPVRNPAFPQALAAAIERLVLDPSERRDLGAAARARAETCFRESRMVERYVDLATRAASVAA